MTHNGGQPHINVGDRGQPYEVTYDDGDGNRKVMGWAETTDGVAKMMRSIEQHPEWHSPQWRDRRTGETGPAASEASRVSDVYLQSSLKEISRAKALDSQMISTAFLRMLLTEIVERRAAAEPPAGPQTVNEWFCALPRGRQDVLVENKWMLADAAYEAGKRAAQPPCTVIPDKVFDGYSVWTELLNDPEARQRTSHENVQDVLNAIVRFKRNAQPPNDVIRTRAFWSRDRRDLISAYVSDTDITLMDDNGHIYEPAGDEQRHGASPAKCPDCHSGRWYAKNGPTGAQETCKNPWHEQAKGEG